MKLTDNHFNTGEEAINVRANLYIEAEYIEVLYGELKYRFWWAWTIKQHNDEVVSAYNLYFGILYLKAFGVQYEKYVNLLIQK